MHLVVKVAIKEAEMILGHMRSELDAHVVREDAVKNEHGKPKSPAEMTLAEIERSAGLNRTHHQPGTLAKVAPGYD